MRPFGLWYNVFKLFFSHGTGNQPFHAKGNEMTAITDIRGLVTADPAAVVDRLKEGDMDYWEAVRREVINPFLADGTANGRRLKDKSVSRDDIYDRLWEKMVEERKLDALRKPEAVLTFLLDYTRSFVSGLFEHKKDLVRPDGTLRQRRKIQEVSVERDDDSDDTRESGIESLAQPSADEPPDGEVYETLRRSFEALWRKNPRRALVLLLRFVKRLSADDVRAFLDLVSENYVNQVVNVAKGNLQASMLPVSRLIRTGPSNRAKRASERKHLYDGSAFNIVFAADFPDEEAFFWRAEVYVGENVANDDEIDIRVMDRKGKPTPAGTLRFLTERLKVKDGRTACTLLRLRELLTIPDVALVTARWGAVPGHLKVE